MRYNENKNEVQNYEEKHCIYYSRHLTVTSICN